MQLLLLFDAEENQLHNTNNGQVCFLLVSIKSLLGNEVSRTVSRGTATKVHWFSLKFNIFDKRLSRSAALMNLKLQFKHYRSSWNVFYTSWHELHVFHKEFTKQI